MSAIRLLYYATWAFADASLIACGFAFGGKQEVTPPKKEPEYNWDGILNINIIDLEFARSPITMARHWDVSQKVWLKHYLKPFLQTTAGALTQNVTPFMINLVGTFFLSFLQNFCIPSSLLYSLQLTCFC